MATPGVMTKFLIHELSGVDRPAQGGARAAIMKRDQGQTPEEIAAAAALAKQANPGHPPVAKEFEMTAIAKALGLPEAATEAEVAAAIAKLSGDLKTVSDGAEILKAKAAMTDGEKKFMDGKPDAEVCKFMAKSADERASDIAKAASGDETVEIEGRTISKRAVGDDMFAIMKAQAKRITDSEAAIAKANEAAATATFEKKAGDEYKHLAGSVAERGAVLKYLDAAPETVKKAAEAILKAAEAASAFAFTKRGTSIIKGGEGAGDTGEPAGAGEKLTKMATDLVEKSAGAVSFAKAYDQVAQANPDLYAEATGVATAE